ncbi:MAG: hypothetical protein M0C28_16040 [Candidatus Moduliflexus flocculans]|nr:hypothetical protein [Candidatus Moduliflexus flocculans]
MPHESRAGGVSHGASSARATRIGPAARAAGASANPRFARRTRALA